MKKIVFQLLFLALVVFSFNTAQAWALKPLKGSWTFMVVTPMGALPVPVTFKSKGKGAVSVPTGTLTMSYREKDANISLCFEGPGLSPDGGDLTFVIRGTK